MSAVRRFAVAGVEQAVRRGGRRGGLVIGAIDETGQEKAGEATAGVKRQYMRCASRVANWINTGHLSYVRERTGHALAGARQWIPREHIEDPVKSLVMGLPPDLEFRTKGQLVTDICASCYTDAIGFDFICPDEVYGNCTQLREYFEEHRQAYVLCTASYCTASIPSRGASLAARSARRQCSTPATKYKPRDGARRVCGNTWPGVEAGGAAARQVSASLPGATAMHGGRGAHLSGLCGPISRITPRARCAPSHSAYWPHERRSRPGRGGRPAMGGD